MTDPAFTVMLPVNRPPALLPYAIASVQAQERQDFELFVICDGAPPETAQTARRFAADDPRIRVFENPKGERNGEVHRHQALFEARGTYVSQLGDDDYWLPNHLSEMARLLEQFDFGNLSQVEIMPDGKVELLGGDVADPRTRHIMATQAITPCGPTSTGYRLEAYRALPVGWSPAPPDLPSDLYMWRKFLAHERLRFGTRVVVSSVKFSAQFRRGWSIEQRRAEIEAWLPRLSNPDGRRLITEAAMLSISQAAFTLRRHVELMDREALEGAKRIREKHEQLLQADADIRKWAKRASEAEAQLQQAVALLRDRAVQAAEMEERMRQLNAMLGEAANRTDQVARQLQESSRHLQKMEEKEKKRRRSWSWRLTKPFRRLARKP
jgi:glycosyltransferase involved in cell wall biosynthesis